MTQIRSMAQPVQRRPGELGVHSLDHFNFVVPDVAQAEKFYGLFGLNTKEEDGKLALYTHGHPHRWGVVSEGPRKKFTYVSFGAFEDDISRFRERLEKLGLEVPEREQRTPEYLARFLETEIRKWAAPIKAAGIVPE